jgi:hypothetical protein
LFCNYIIEICGIGIYDRIIVSDYKRIMEDSCLSRIGEDFGYKIVCYEDIEEFRYLYESEIKKNQDKYLVLIKEDLYLPYDIRCEFNLIKIDYKKLFPRLNAYMLEIPI